MKGTDFRGAWQIRVELNGTRPPVWRRLLVPEKMTLSGLHGAIQDAFGWQNYHLHEFVISGVHYSDPATDEYGELDFQDEANVMLRKLGLEEGGRFLYLYDFGDGWEHTLRVEKILPVEGRERMPRCLEGKRACPPEDVGGVEGYAGFLKALADPTHSEHEEYLTWIGGAFDPEAFDLAAANKRLRMGARGKRASGWDVPGEGKGTAGAAVLDASGWRSLAGAEHVLTAQELPLRRDIETFLSYIRDHKVTGTSSTGNLPLKAVAEVSAGFVHPPPQETSIGDMVFPSRSEEDVWPVYFAHVLAQGADLVSGGPGRRWRLTARGESFLSAPAVAQVSVLLSAWWYKVNWLLAVPFDIFGEQLPPDFPAAVLRVLGEAAVGQPVEFEPFVDRLISEVGLTWTESRPGSIRSSIGSAVEQMVVDPLEEFGMLLTEHVREAGRLFDSKRLVSFSLTGFGQGLMDALR